MTEFTFISLMTNSGLLIHPGTRQGCILNGQSRTVDSDKILCHHRSRIDHVHYLLS